MDKTENKIEHDTNLVERERIRKQRLDAQSAAETRKENIENRHNMEIEKSTEKRLLSRKPTPDEVANLRRRSQLEGKRDSDRLEQLAHKKNLSTTQKLELQEKLADSLDKTDAHWREADRSTNDGLSEFKKNGVARIEFSHLAGTSEHSRWEEEILQMEQRTGRVRGVDFELEAMMQNPDGKPVRLDYVDYQKDIIIDRKPIATNETEEQLKKKYETQMNRHIEAYEHTTGRKVLEYRYSLTSVPILVK